METLDKCFENVCELDLIFHMDKVGKTRSTCSSIEALKALCILYWQVSVAAPSVHSIFLMIYKLKVTCTGKDTKSMTAFPFG